MLGTHTAVPFTPMPGKLPPVDTTGKQVLIGPETFALYTDDAGKVVKTTITPKHGKDVTRSCRTGPSPPCV